MASTAASSPRSPLRAERRGRLRAATICGFAAAIGGCAADLLPGEWAVPGEVPARVWTGEPESAFGTAIAVQGERVLVASPGQPLSEILGEGAVDRPAVAVWFDGERGLAGLLDLGVVEVPGGSLVASIPGARVYAGEEGFWVAATPEVVLASDGRSWSLPDTRALAVGGGRILAMACAGECAAYDLGEPGAAEGEAAALGRSAEGGQVALWEGEAWWSDPELALDDGAGVVWSESGAEVRGLAGDHLGRAIGGGYAVGALNPKQVPARARVLPLGGGDALALDRSAETRPLALAGDDGTLLIGVPAWPEREPLVGAVFAIRREDLPR